MKKISIKNIYAGKPDAKDEINFEGLEDFIKVFVVPSNCNLDNLIKGNYCFITGFKGTGKTALLFYLDNLIREQDNSACSSFVFFKEEFADLKKSKFDAFSKRVLSSIIIEQDTLLKNTDFEYIWRWLFFKRLVSDNDDFHGGLFVDNDDWKKFVKITAKIKGPANIKKSIIPPKIKLGVPYLDPNSGAMLSPEIEVDFQNNENSNFINFVELIDEAEEALFKLKRTDIPYHIFVDELEAYFGDEVVFKRDLYLIRDLIFTVKRFNSIFSASNMENTKIICSVRTEIINAITKFKVTKELNKVTSGFEVPLRWNYNNTNSYAHPIIQILLRRIALSETETGETLRSDKEIAENWFPEEIHDIDPASYILNNGWCKPRDIVRLIISAQNCLHNDSNYFSQAVFTSLNKQYSFDSLVEIKEEMRALYTSDEIETIVNCFTGFRAMFSVNQLRSRVSEYFNGTILDERFIQVLNDLYRLGFIGNYLPSSQRYRWQHKGDERLILADDWRIMIHQALQSALSIGKKQDYGLKRFESPQIGDMVDFRIEKISKSFVDGNFTFFQKSYTASIHISQIAEGYIRDIKEHISEGEEVKAKVIGYNDQYFRWMLSLKY